MEIFITLADVFIFICLLIIVFVFAPNFFKDVRKMWTKDTKSSAEDKSAERVKKNYYKNSITETPVNLQKQSCVFGFKDDLK